MVASQKVMDALRTIGLNKYERHLWAALLSRGASTAGELSDISHVPRSRCYDVLESLAVRGFVMLQPGKPMRYVAIPPREALERAKKKIHEDKDELCKKIDRFVKSDAIKELERIHKENIKTVQPEDLSGSLRGRYAMTLQMETMFKKAKKSIKLMTTENGLNDILENHMHHLKKASSNGVKIKIAAHIGKNSDAIKELEKLADIRDIANADNIEKMLGRLVIIDGSEFLLGLTDDEKTHPTQDVSLWTQSGHASSSVFEPMFEMVWTNAKPVKN
ncbi:MAG TPA: helix-turn-helix domain-containing protein [archaeon]|nr:helix-turn-helix domain-containing protein [archaeon]